MLIDVEARSLMVWNHHASPGDRETATLNLFMYLFIATPHSMWDLSA